MRRRKKFKKDSTDSNGFARACKQAKRDEGTAFCRSIRVHHAPTPKRFRCSHPHPTQCKEKAEPAHAATVEAACRRSQRKSRREKQLCQQSDTVLNVLQKNGRTSLSLKSSSNTVLKASFGHG